MENLTNESLTTVQATTSKSGNGKANLPRKESDLITVAQSVQLKMKETGICPLWTNAEEMKAKIMDIDTAKNNIRSLKSKKKQATAEIKFLNAEIDIGVGYIKQALYIQFGRERAKSYAHEFGLDIKRGRTILKANMDDRLRSLVLLKNAVEKYNLNAGKYNPDFWTSSYERLSSQWNASKGLSSQISSQVSQKNKNMDYLNRALHSVILLLRAHYENNYKSVLRAWGILKESF